MKTTKTILAICLIITLFQVACVNNKRLAYFYGLKDTTFTTSYLPPTIKKGDILYIGVTGADPLSASIFNTVNNVSAANGGINVVSNVITPGILVPESGNIELPKIGSIQVIGKTTQALSLEIQKAITDYVKNPLVTVRYMNFRLSVLGEVSRPGIFTINNEKITILETLALAGDLTVYGKRDNILLIREQNGIQQIKRINLKNESLLTSPYYYLQPNDVLYVEPYKAKGYSGTDTAILLPIATSAITIILLIINQFK